jgi:hypothetical protein
VCAKCEVDWLIADARQRFSGVRHGSDREHEVVGEGSLLRLRANLLLSWQARAEAREANVAEWHLRTEDAKRAKAAWDAKEGERAEQRRQARRREREARRTLRDRLASELREACGEKAEKAVRKRARDLRVRL